MSRRTHVGTIPALGSASAVLLATVLLAGCGGGSSDSQTSPAGNSTPPQNVTSTPPAVAQAKAQNTPVDPTLVSANNTFGLNLLNTLIQGSPNTNIAISPTSVAMALQIAYNGAEGTTQSAMAQTLQLGSLSVSQLNDDNAALLAALLDPDPQVTLTIANSLWVRLSGITVSPTFQSTDQAYYGATIGDLAQAPAAVNTWGSQQTDGLISQILPTDINLSDTVAILANVVYFKGAWQSAFDPSQTKPAPFTLADGTQTTVNMMEQTQASFPVMSGTNFTAISLPYGQGRLSMIAVLPSAGVDLATFISTLTPADIDSWVGQMSNSEAVNLSLPRFTTSFAANLIPPLTTLGMGIAFSPTMADLSGIYPLAYISWVQHDTVVQVDEQGTVATGSTTVGIGIGAVQQPVNLDFNRPFFYTIRDNQTGALLFAGVMVNPNGG